MGGKILVGVIQYPDTSKVLEIQGAQSESPSFFFLMAICCSIYAQPYLRTKPPIKVKENQHQNCLWFLSAFLLLLSKFFIFIFFFFWGGGGGGLGLYLFFPQHIKPADNLNRKTQDPGGNPFIFCMQVVGFSSMTQTLLNLELVREIKFKGVLPQQLQHPSCINSYVLRNTLSPTGFFFPVLSE